MRIHITGAAGSGVTSLGAGLAGILRLRHIDTDDFYWLPTELPMTERRDPTECRLQIGEAQAGGRWVLSGSLMGWGEPLLDGVDAILFLSAPTALRLDRLRLRERLRHGALIAPGGPLNARHETFMAWAERYDDPGFRGRSRATHEDWRAGQTAPVIRLDGSRDVPVVLSEALAALATPRVA